MGEAIRFQARDGYELAGDYFAPAGEARGAVLFAPAMGVPRRLYAPLASYLAEGGLAALTLDYRGIGDSRRGSLQGFEASMHGWGELDLGGALDELARRAPGAPLSWLGHSAGGQLFGLLPDAPVRSVLLVGSQSGHWRHWGPVGKAVMFGLWHAFIPGVVAATGYLPMKALGQGEDVPGGVALEWARWGRHRDYIYSYARERGGLGFARYAGPLRAYAVSDDSYAPRAAVEALVGYYPKAASEVRVVRPADVGARAIGHFGFFRPALRDTLWAEARSWLLGAAPARASA